MKSTSIDTDYFSERIRERLISPGKKVLLANLNHTKEAEDAYTKINCKGYGRVRVFKDFKLHLHWNPVFKKPLYRNHPPIKELRTQAFQLAGCNWRCWYCFVDFGLLDGNKDKGQFFSADEILDFYLQESDRPHIIDLTGGQPDLVPEWSLWMLESIEKKGLNGKIYVWTDDNLSNFYLWKYLSKTEIDYIVKFPLFNRIACLKGYNYESFVFNTKAQPKDFDNQFQILKKLISSGFDMYSYVTFTTPSIKNLENEMRQFVDKLSTIHPNLPLRIIPLKIHGFRNTMLRAKDTHKESINLQVEVIKAWENELLYRFSTGELQKPFSQIKLD
jgi:uncharacterized Fe-S cluster-containing radical SAM superfamily protein